MTEAYIHALLNKTHILRDQAGFSATELEDRLILGPGWISRFESGETIPSIDMLLAIVREMGFTLDDLLNGLPVPPENPEVERHIFAEQSGNDIIINFRYANFDAHYLLSNSTVDEFEEVIKTLRDGLARLASVDQEMSEAIKTDSVAKTFLKTVEIWQDANPSDLWWFLVYRAYCDPYNHPAQFARLDFTQSWKRTSGWALEEVLVRHYGPFLKDQGINLFIANGAVKKAIVKNLDVGDRIEADKIDVMITGGNSPHSGNFFGVVHVKSSFAERRTDDIPMSIALSNAGYTSPLWTMDCKSSPSANPVNRGELGSFHGRRSAKRKDIEDEGYFTGCFSYNKNTRPSRDDLPSERRIYVCDFKNPDDVFSQFIADRWQAFRSA